ncbi:MAG: hypothetical protein GY853_06290 [PVC group bacterium]|nr:hypothetical protein [PVC group bacterium]
MLKRLLKILIGIAFLPLCVGITRSLYAILNSLRVVDKLPMFFLAGIIVYVVMHLLVYKPDYLYVLAHESVHAFFALLFGGKIKSFRVTSQGGSVASTKSNFIITLAPYFFPLYTAILSLIFWGICLFWKEAYQYTNIFIFLIGFSLAFHFLMNADSLKTKQPDLVENGYLFSLTLIYIINILVLVIPLSFIFKKVSLVVFFKDFWLYSKETVFFIWDKILEFTTSAR